MQVRYLSRHELTNKEFMAMLNWRDTLEAICKVGNTTKSKIAHGSKKHFVVELARVNKFIKNYPR